MNKKLNIYVWENVLEGYTPGLAVIIASSLDEAKAVFLKKYPNGQYVLDNFFGQPHEIVTEPDAFYVYGGD